jgi:hypothetical protein
VQFLALYHRKNKLNFIFSPVNFKLSDGLESLYLFNRSMDNTLFLIDMNLNFPDEVTLIEVGPRDGFQFETKIIPTELKIEIISCLVNAGIKNIQVTSFVHPRLVPQMADAEALLQRLPKKKDVAYSGLALNSTGF